MPVTSWTIIGKTRGNGPEAEQALNRLCGLYWKPVYAWFRARGLSNEAAKDLTQDFFGSVIERRDLFQRYDPDRGRFRAFIFRRMQWFWVDHLRKRGTGGDKRTVSFDEGAPEPEADEKYAPDREFDRNWARETLEAAKRVLAASLIASGHELRLRVFELRVWQRLSVADTAQHLGVSEEKVKNELRAYYRALVKTLRDLVRATVNTDADTEEELAYLRRLLGNEP